MIRRLLYWPDHNATFDSKLRNAILVLHRGGWDSTFLKKIGMDSQGIKSFSGQSGRGMEMETEMEMEMFDLVVLTVTFIIGNSS